MQFAHAKWLPLTPRQCQIDAFDAVRRHTDWSSEPPVASMVMGSGKSVLIAELCACAVLKPDEIVVVSTSTQALVETLFADIRKRCQFDERTVGLWYGRRKRYGQVIVTCMPSMGALAEMLQGRGRRVKLWIADEAHRTQSDTVLTANQLLQPENALGLTATAFRADDDDTLTLFKRLIYRYGVAEAKADGIIVPIKLNHYDGASDDLDVACLEMARKHEGPGLTNAVSIQDAEDFARYLTANGVLAAAIHSKLTPAAQGKVLRDLESGAIKAAVHVNLLTEGANYPWLRWLQFRREVDSRLRFIQELGRGLRAFPGKTVCELDDPHDLYGGFSMTYAEALGEAPVKPEWEQEAMPYEERAERIHSADPPVAMAFIESIVRSLVVACDCSHLLGRRKFIKKADRLKPSTPLQLVAMDGAIANASGYAPAGWLACLEEIKQRPDCLRFGFASDLLSSLEGIRQHKTWPNIDSGGRIDVTTEPFPHTVGANGQTEVDFHAFEEEKEAG